MVSVMHGMMGVSMMVVQSNPPSCRVLSRVTSLVREDTAKRACYVEKTMEAGKTGGAKATPQRCEAPLVEGDGRRVRPPKAADP